MILLVEPISKNIDMYIPAYPLPILEIGSYIKSHLPGLDIKIISIPVDYGLPLDQKGKEEIYASFLEDVQSMKPSGVGISCTAISQAEEAIHLSEAIKAADPNIFVFMGGYFPTLYYEELLSRTSAVDIIVLGEGEPGALRIVSILEKGGDPLGEEIPNTAYRRGGEIHANRQPVRVDLSTKAPMDLGLLKYPMAYDILPYSFSRGCPYQCNFCMEEFIRPIRREVPSEVVREDLGRLSKASNAKTLMVSDALFRSFHLFPMLRSLGLKVNFETRSDVMDPSIIPEISNAVGMIALGFESASFDTLKRMNKVKDRSHYAKYVGNTVRVFEEAVRNDIPIMIFMIAGYPGDTEKDLEESLQFVRELSRIKGPGGYVFKIGECRVYPKTKLYKFAKSLPDVIFHDNGVFSDNVVTRTSRDLDFEKILAYMEEIFHLSNPTERLQGEILNMMPFFRLPAKSLKDASIPECCYRGTGRGVFDARSGSLRAFREAVPALTAKYKKLMAGERSIRQLDI
ncbi:MAG: B12-binding domain-containing radical SAM protein [Deltaproteobacteria bacterium]|nr:B12-binding domain-containing radical SAM protein [Deltaproteobacteria bacterium]MBW2136844.1 B12-binding domain-containing radical SAM protein [Deltaproteobacteria bacterium]